MVGEVGGVDWKCGAVWRCVMRCNGRGLWGLRLWVWGYLMVFDL